MKAIIIRSSAKIVTIQREGILSWDQLDEESMKILLTRTKAPPTNLQFKKLHKGTGVLNNVIRKENGEIIFWASSIKKNMNLHRVEDLSGNLRTQQSELSQLPYKLGIAMCELSHAKGKGW